MSKHTTGDRGVLGLYTATMLTSAALLFVVQPMFARMVLPLLGGSPAVWNTALVFYQVVLLAGYSYAYAVSRWVPLSGAVAAPHRGHPPAVPGAADWRASRRRPRNGRRPGAVAPRHSGCRRRPAVLRRIDHEPVAPAMVRRDGPSARRRPVLSLRRQQPRQPRRARRISPRRRALAHSGRPEPVVAMGLRRPRRASSGLSGRRLAHEPKRRFGNAGGGRHERRRAGDLGGSGPVAGSGGCSSEPDAERHDVHLDGCGRHSVALGDSPRDLSDDVHPHVRAASAGFRPGRSVP